jgi:hypothetical protein
MIHSYPLFPTEVIHLRRPDDWEQRKVKLLELFKDEPEYHNESYAFSDFFRDTNDFDYRREFSYLMAKELIEFTNAAKEAFPDIEDLEMNHIWTQRYKRTESMAPHSHGPRGFSGVLYVEFIPGEHEGTVLQGYSNHPITQELNQFVPDVQEGDMVIFPSSMPHFANPSESDLTRTIMSFNLDIVYRKH